VQYASLTLSQLLIENNTGGSGAGICVDSGSTPLLEHLQILNNEAKAYWGGGGLYVNGMTASPVVRNVVISGNMATKNGNATASHGGGMTISGGSPDIASTIITGNQSDLGGGVYISSGSTPAPLLTNVTISGNTALSSGGGIYAFFSNGRIVNSIIWGNSAPEANAILIRGQGSEDFEISYTLYSNGPGDTHLQGGFSGYNNLTGDPLFVDAPAATTAPFANGDYRLLENSPAINAGSNEAVPSNHAVDLDGNPRIHDLELGGLVDLGAYESIYGNLVRPDAHGIVYVDSAITDAGDGSSWQEALNTSPPQPKQRRISGTSTRYTLPKARIIL